MDVIFGNIRAWEQFIFRENRNKRHPFDFFGPKYSLVLAELTFFWTKYGHDNRSFSCKIWKKITSEHSVLERIDVCMTKHAHESSLFLENGRFSIKHGHESIFFVKLEKRASNWLFGPIIYSVILTELTFFWQIVVVTAGAFIKSFKKWH